METNMIKVTGHGGIHIVPDVTRVKLSLVSLHQTYDEAYMQAKRDNESIQQMMEELQLPKTLPKTLKIDIEKKSIREYDKYNNYTGDRFLGFELTHLVRMDLEMDNILLNQIIKSIGLKLRQAEIEIGYTVRDTRKAQLKMLERAVKDAKEKAEIMASAAGCRLGECLTIEYGLHEIHIYSQARTIHDMTEASLCTPDSLDITPEDLSVSEKIDVNWALLNG